MTGKLFVIALVLSAAIGGAAMYWLQVYAFYEPVEEPRIELTTLQGTVEPILAENVQAIDADSSPIRYRACFETPMSEAMMSETYVLYDEATPLNAPDWFDCFSSTEIGEALETGQALAFLGVENIEYGIDRVVAVLPDGRGFAWHQINRCGERVFDGDPPPEGCPLPPERTE